MYYKRLGYLISLTVTGFLFVMILDATRAHADTINKIEWPKQGARHLMSNRQTIASNQIDSISETVSPAINNPNFINSEESSSDMLDQDGIGICIENECKFYGYDILLWHNIVNDKIGETPIMVYYNDKYGISAVYNRETNGDILNFKNSNKLWQGLQLISSSEDLSKESLWSPTLGEAVSGVRVRQQLSGLSFQSQELKEWLLDHPSSRILSRHTGFIRPYGANFETLPITEKPQDKRLTGGTTVIGLFFNSRFIAIPLETLPIGKSEFIVNKEKLSVSKYVNNKIGLESNKYIGNAPSIISNWTAWSRLHPSTIILK